ncbi:MAG TPA: hypothetical protein VEX88_14345, partial [Glaciibacter sp.]|nr:hypothetical protein [Glaciibacter sp.]
ACSMICASSSNGISFSRSISRNMLRSMSIAGLLYSDLAAAKLRSGLGVYGTSVSRAASHVVGLAPGADGVAPSWGRASAARSPGAR